MDAAWSVDGQHLATVDSQGRLVIWDASCGARLQDLGRNAGTTCIAWRPDGARLVTTSAWATVSLWDAASGELLSTWRAPDSMVTAASWDASGGRIVVALGDTSACYLDEATWTPRFVHAEDPRELPETTTYRTQARVLGAAGAELLHLFAARDFRDVACSRVGRNMTLAEWERFMGEETPYRETCLGLASGG